MSPLVRQFLLGTLVGVVMPLAMFAFLTHSPIHEDMHMSKQFKVSAYLVTGAGDTFTKTIQAGLTSSKATSLRDSLEESNSNGNFDPNEVISYLVEPCSPTSM